MWKYTDEPDERALHEDRRAIGSGLEAAAGNLLTVHYTGWLYDAAKPT